jgi:hypothetical protein
MIDLYSAAPRQVFALALIPLLLEAGAPVAAASFAVPDFRGDPHTTYFGWDFFEQTPDKEFPLNFYLLDSTPDLGTNPGGALAKQNNDTPFTDWGNISNSNNLYSGPWGPFDLSVFVPTAGTSASPEATTVIFQLRENGGTPLNPFLLDGQPADESAVSDIGGRRVHYNLWNLTDSNGLHEITITSLGAHGAIDALIVDTQVTPIPLPAAAWLFTSALIGTAVMRRKVSRAA